MPDGGNPDARGGVGSGASPIVPPVVPGVAGREIAPGGAIGPVGPASLVAVPGLLQAVVTPSAGPAEIPAGRPISPIFNIGGAPIAILGGVFSAGLPIAGPVTQIFRGGAAPVPPTLYISTLSSSGPISQFFLGQSGAPIGVPTLGGGGLPIGAEQAIEPAVASIQARTAMVGAPAVAFGASRATGPVPPIGPGGVYSSDS